MNGRTLFVFDLDGTLVDSQRDIADSANAVLEECGCARLPEQAIASMVGDGAAVLIARAFAAAGCSGPPDALDRFLRIYHTRLLEFTRPYTGIPELLSGLSVCGSLAVLTNKPLSATQAILDGLGLAPHFGDLVLGGDGPFPRKPDTAGLANLMERTAASADNTLLIGDSAVDMRTAHSAGVRACVARYGFGYGSVAVDEIREIDWVIDRPADLLRLL
jgi:phosphoglycolate phosphatase